MTTTNLIDSSLVDVVGDPYPPPFPLLPSVSFAGSQIVATVTSGSSFTPHVTLRAKAPLNGIVPAKYILSYTIAYDYSMPFDNEIERSDDFSVYGVSGCGELVTYQTVGTAPTGVSETDVEVSFSPNACGSSILTDSILIAFRGPYSFGGDTFTLTITRFDLVEAGSPFFWANPIGTSERVL